MSSQPRRVRLPARIYWFRRLLVIVVVALCVWLGTGLVAGWGDDPVGVR